MQHLFLDTAGGEKLRLELDRAQIGEKVQAFAERKDPAFGPVGRVGTVPFRPSNRAKQHGFSRGRGLQRFVRKAGAKLIDGASADNLMVKRKAVAEPIGYNG